MFEIALFFSNKTYSNMTVSCLINFASMIKLWYHGF